MPTPPFVKNKRSICIICEGFEEESYIKKLINLNVWSCNNKNCKTLIFKKY